MTRLHFSTRASTFISTVALSFAISSFAISARADENLFGYVKGAETLPAQSWETYLVNTLRRDKGVGSYRALDTDLEAEYGFTNSFNASLALNFMDLETQGILINAYVPQDKKLSFRPVGAEASFKYNFLSPAKDDIGLSSLFSMDSRWVDRHSGQAKDSFSYKLLFILQKYFLEGQLIVVANGGAESTYAHRAPIADLDPAVEWPVHPEMEIEPIAGLGVSYRFIPNWFLGAETLYEGEYETEVGLERWSIFAGPSLHYGGQTWWATLTWFQQLRGGGEVFDAQIDDQKLHLIEKTKSEARLKIGFNF